MIAVGLIYGELKAEHYEDDFACNSVLDQLREKMVIYEDKRYSSEYHEAEKSIHSK